MENLKSKRRGKIEIREEKRNQKIPTNSKYIVIPLKIHYDMVSKRKSAQVKRGKSEK